MGEFFCNARMLECLNARMFAGVDATFLNALMLTSIAAAIFNVDVI